MDSTDKEIKQFEALENSDKISMDLKDIQDLDQWMKSLPLKKVGTNFTSTVIASALLAKKRHANFKILVWMMAFFGILIITSYFLMGSGEPSFEFTYLDNVREQSFKVLDIIADPKLRQLFLIIEGIICLVVIEKLVSSFRILRHSV
ncbi:MAG: hypothetical protein ABJF04_20425 [Reichenbachiella sp.]|uniref:hypothetical protein n=1 Tax=Reichenbachiella sp. TaxID=2184521 RepID=UPI003266601F